MMRVSVKFINKWYRDNLYGKEFKNINPHSKTYYGIFGNICKSSHGYQKINVVVDGIVYRFSLEFIINALKCGDWVLIDEIYIDENEN